VLELEVLRGGLTRLVCPRCERFKAGICRDCPQPVSGQVRKARRCASCTKRARHEMIVKYRTNNRTLVNRRGKLSARKNRQRNADYKRLWRAANREKIAAQKRRYMLRQPQTLYAYLREYRKTYRYEPGRVRYCLGGCGAIVRHRVKKCTQCKESLRSSALRMLGRTHAV